MSHAAGEIGGEPRIGVVAEEDEVSHTAGRRAENEKRQGQRGEKLLAGEAPGRAGSDNAYERVEQCVRDVVGMADVHAKQAGGDGRSVVLQVVVGDQAEWRHPGVGWRDGLALQEIVDHVQVRDAIGGVHDVGLHAAHGVGKREADEEDGGGQDQHGLEEFPDHGHPQRRAKKDGKKNEQAGHGDEVLDEVEHGHERQRRHDEAKPGRVVGEKPVEKHGPAHHQRGDDQPEEKYLKNQKHGYPRKGNFGQVCGGGQVGLFDVTSRIAYSYWSVMSYHLANRLDSL